MGEAKLTEVPDEAALRTIEWLLHKYTKHGKARLVNLIFTSKRFEDLTGLEGLVTRPHYGIMGLLSPGVDAKSEAASLLTSEQTRVLLILSYPRYPSGDLCIYFRSAAESSAGSLQIDGDSSWSDRWLNDYLDDLMPVLGVEEVSDSPPPGGGNLSLTSFAMPSRDGINALFPPDLEGRVCEVARRVVARLEQPSKTHLMLTGPLETVRHLHESGKVAPCVRCCSVHFEYLDLLTEQTDVDLSRLDEVVAFLAERRGRDRVLSFRRFTWSWEEGFDPVGNAIVWSVPKRGPGVIEVQWYNPPPRGALGALRKDVRRFLAGKG